MTTLAFPLETAQRHQQKGEFPKAERCCRQVLTADPYNAEAAFLLATSCQAQNKTKEALAHLEHALRIRPNYAEARHARGWCSPGAGMSTRPSRAAAGGSAEAGLCRGAP